MTAALLSAPSEAPVAEPRLRVRGDVRLWALDLQLWLIGLAPILSALAAPRYFASDFNVSIAAGANNSTVSRLSYLLAGRGLLVVSAVGLVLMLPTLRATAAGARLTAGFCAVAGASLLASRLGTEPASFIPPAALLLVGLTWYAAPVVSVPWLARRLVVLFRVYVAGSIVAAVVAPGWAIERPYPDHFLPGIDFRLHGLAPHANLLAPIVLLGLIVEGLRPTHSTSARLWRIAGVGVLVLTQSKTTLVAALAVLLVEWFRRSRDKAPGQRLVADAMLAVGAVAVGVFAWLGTGLAESSEGAASLHTLAARQQVWSVTLELWHQNPLFGFGLHLWDTDMRLAYLAQLGWAPPHAHNQLVQSLGEAGLIGAAALLVYVVAMTSVGFRVARASAGASLAIVIVMVVRGLTECPIERAGGDILVPFVAFVVLLTLARSLREPVGDQLAHGGAA